MMRYAILFIGILVLISSVNAVPDLPTEFYGEIYSGGNPGFPGATITLELIDGTQCGGSFTIVTPGKFGLLTCPIDDPQTPAIDGVPEGSRINVFYNGEQAAVLSGDNLTEAGTFKFLNLSHPLPFCGDGTCDQFFESLAICPADCTVTGGNETNGTNGTGGGEDTNGTGGEGSSGNESGSGGESDGSGGSSGGSSGAGGGSGGGGGGGGGAGLFDNLLEYPASLGFPLTDFPYSCNEQWDCSEWGSCTIDGLRERICIDQAECGSSENKPSTIEECTYIPSCFNGVQDFEETGVDCGGSCLPCASCTNGVQDCHLQEDGSLICEEGIDCGGACRSCNSCFNGVRDWTESGVDCGGLYCNACYELPTLAFPTLICEKNANPLTNAGIWFVVLLLLFISIRVYFYLRKIDEIHSTHSIDDYKRARDYFAERRKMVIFLAITLCVGILAYGYYYEFLLCDLEYGYLWWFIVLLLLVPFLIYSLWRFMEYKDKEKLIKLGLLDREHQDAMQRMLDVENQQIVELEEEIRKIIEELTKKEDLQAYFSTFPELKVIYKDIIRLYFEYQSNKSPYGIEKELCEQVYGLETNEQFQELAGKHPIFWRLFERLKVLYGHYESKQEVYAKIEEERERIQKHAQSNESAVPEEKDSEETGSQ